MRRWFRAMFVKARPVLQMPPAKFAAFVYDDFCAAFRAVLKRVLANFFLPVVRVDLDSLPVLNMDSALVADKFVAIQVVHIFVVCPVQCSPAERPGGTLPGYGENRWRQESCPADNDFFRAYAVSLDSLLP